MGWRREEGVLESRKQVVECFLSRRSSASLDGSVHTNGDTLCVENRHLAFWHQGVVFLMPIESPDSLVREVQTMVQLGKGGHRVVEIGEKDELL